MAAKLALPVPTKPEDEDLPETDREGFDAFARSVDLDANPHLFGVARYIQWARGWHLGWARCYGLGVKASITATAEGREADSPFPLHSGPWQAWAEGHDDEGSIL